MGSKPKTPKVPKLPPEPEPVKYAEGDAAATRASARAAAARRYGALGTDVTKGTLSGQVAPTKKRKLGGE